MLSYHDDKVFNTKIKLVLLLFIVELILLFVVEFIIMSNISQASFLFLINKNYLFITSMHLNKSITKVSIAYQVFLKYILCCVNDFIIKVTDTKLHRLVISVLVIYFIICLNHIPLLNDIICQVLIL